MRLDHLLSRETFRRFALYLASAGPLDPGQRFIAERGGEGRTSSYGVGEVPARLLVDLPIGLARAICPVDGSTTDLVRSEREILRAIQRSMCVRLLERSRSVRGPLAQVVRAQS